MCVIVASPKGQTPSRSDLDAACTNNPQGFGWAVAAKEEMWYWHGMNSQQAIDLYLDKRRQHLHSPSVFHARIATHSTADLAGCHPFPVAGDQTVQLFHNGMLDQCEPGPFDKRSDTAILAQDIIPANGGVESLWQHQTVWERWLGKDNKVVILSALVGKPHLTILNQAGGRWHNGSWWSNPGWHVATPWAQWSGTPMLSSGALDWNKGALDWKRCEFCGMQTAHRLENVVCCFKCEQQLEMVPEEKQPAPLDICSHCDILDDAGSMVTYQGELWCRDCLPVGVA